MKRLSDRLPIVVIGIIGIAYTIMALMMPLLGDDMGYAHNYLTNYQGATDLPLIMGRHWFHVNSRMADMVNSVWLCMIPRWGLSALCGLMVALYFIITAKCANVAEPFRRSLLAALLLFTLPWWDSFFLFVCQFNYVWSSVLVLLVMGFVTDSVYVRKRLQWLLPPVALLAGWMHEAAGLPAACGLIAWLVVNRNFTSLPRLRQYTIAIFCIGAALSATSPASWSRAAHVDPNDPMWLLLLKSDFYALLLAGIITGMFFFRRHIFRALLRSPWTVFATAAIASMCISAIGGIVGRSGWFAQTFALIALFRSDMPLRRMAPTVNMQNIIVITLSLIMTLHVAETVRWQVKADAEIEHSLKLYTASPDGTISIDPLQRYDFPWWTLYKNKGVPDADDFYLTETIDRCLGNGKQQFRVLPTAINIKHITGPAKLSRGFVSSIEPTDTDSTGLCHINGIAHTVTPFTAADSTRLYYVAPRIVDPGDR